MYRVVRSFAVVGVMALLLGACQWSMFGYDTARTGYNSSETAVGVGNVGTLQSAWTADTGQEVYSSPAVVNGIVYIGSDSGLLYAYSGAGTTNCSGSPDVCTPLWTANADGTVKSSPAVVNGVVYVNSEQGMLSAFDATGTTNCSGTPKTCAPLWQAFGTDKTSGGPSSPVVADGFVYVGDFQHHLDAYDAAGVNGCSGTPKVCKPVWTATTGNVVSASPSVANGVVYVPSQDHKLYAFDAAGTVNCASGACQPLWTAALDGTGLAAAPVANGQVYVPTGAGSVEVFDANGSTNCSGSPKTCTPLWTATTGGGVLVASPAIANGVMYVGSEGFGDELLAFDANGSTNCSGSPKTCSPLWTSAPSSHGFAQMESSPSVANGVVFIGSTDDNVYAFDAAGVTNCTAGDCNQLWSATTGGFVLSTPVVANGWLYVASTDGKIYGFRTPS